MKTSADMVRHHVVARRAQVSEKGLHRLRAYVRFDLRCLVRPLGRSGTRGHQDLATSSSACDSALLRSKVRCGCWMALECPEVLETCWRCGRPIPQSPKLPTM